MINDLVISLVFTFWQKPTKLNFVHLIASYQDVHMLGMRLSLLLAFIGAIQSLSVVAKRSSKAQLSVQTFQCHCSQFCLLLLAHMSFWGFRFFSIQSGCDRSRWGCSLVEGSAQSRPQTLPSHEEKRSGEPSQISWASAQFCSSVKRFYAKCTQKRYGYSSRDKNFTAVREVLRNNLAISLVHTALGGKTQDIQLYSQDHFSLGGVCGLGMRLTPPCLFPPTPCTNNP